MFSLNAITNKHLVFSCESETLKFEFRDNARKDMLVSGGGGGGGGMLPTYLLTSIAPFDTELCPTKISLMVRRGFDKYCRATNNFHCRGTRSRTLVCSGMLVEFTV
jgi:hypothetical protein